MSYCEEIYSIASACASFEILKENAGYIRHELSQVMRMRTVPSLDFRMDRSMVYGSKMDELFKKIHVDKPADSEDAEK